MDYFAIGGKPFLSRFPPHIPGIFNPAALRPGGEGGVQATPDGSGPTELQQHLQQQLQQQIQLQLQLQQQLQQQLDPEDLAGVDQRAYGSGVVLAGPETSPEELNGSYPRAPTALHTAFDPSKAAAWDPERFELLKKIQDATRNRGQVLLMRDTTVDRLVAVKQMPSRWVRTCHSEFVIEHPSETEMPWQDLGCIQFLNDTGYPYACDLLGLFRDDVHTYVVTSFASEGDLFSWCEAGVQPGHERELVVQPLARQIMESVQQLHDFSIVHRDLSLENILLTKQDGSEELQVKIIDFSMASTSRRFHHCVRGKASYQAPELHTDQEYDAYLSDAFSLGVTLYALLLKDYPWLSTRPGGCKCFEYVKKHGFRSYLAKRKLRNSTAKIADFMSEPLKQLLEGLLALDPAERLTLGERAWGGSRRSVWDEPWMHSGPGEG